ncbi:MAG: hypothetical protein FRX49_04694 [Trebouxia sp. A1-2]|nr:MAG: hypothetical protein FRX49_04694 [Trebouxia sp. A1-2]
MDIEAAQPDVLQVQQVPKENAERRHQVHQAASLQHAFHKLQVKQCRLSQQAQTAPISNLATKVVADA